jgi:hypothetical protein
MIIVAIIITVLLLAAFIAAIFKVEDPDIELIETKAQMFMEKAK